MNLDIYKQDSVDKIALMLFDDCVFSNSNIQEDVELTETVNAGTDFVIGSTCAAQLNFKLLEINSFVDEADFINKEFVYKLGANTEAVSVFSMYRQTRQNLLLKNGSFWYGANEKGNLLTVWKEMDGVLTQQDLPEQPEQPVVSLFIWMGKLYCGHSAEPYVTGYQIRDNGALLKIPVTLTKLQISQVLEQNRRAKIFKYDGAHLYSYEKSWSLGKVSDYIEHVYEFTQLGIFIPQTAQKKDDRILSVTAYDRMIYFEEFADSVLNNQTYPVTVLDFLQSLCAFVGVALKTTEFLNSDYLIQKNARSQNVKGRQMLQWVTEAAARFARITPDGKLALEWYTDVDYSIDASHGGPTEYTTITVADYTTKKVDKLQIKATQNDIGVVVPKDDPSKTNIYIIQNNPIFYAETDAELRPTAEKIFNVVKDFAYVPYTLSCKGNPLIRAGSAFSVTSTKGQKTKALVMSKKMKGVKALTDSLTATGNAIRSAQSNVLNQSIQQLRGSVHELVVDITSLKSTISDYKLETDESLQILKSDIEQNAAQISLRVEKTVYDENMNIVNEHFSSLDQTLEGFRLAVDNHKLIFNADGLSIYNGGFNIYNGSEKIFSIASDGSGLQMVGNIVTSGTSGSVLLSSGIISFSDLSGQKTASIMSIYNGISIIASREDGSVSIGPYIPELNVGTLLLRASRGTRGNRVSYGTVHMGKETFYPVLWK